MLKYILLVFFIFILNTSNSAESLLTLKQRLDRIERDVSDLSKSVFTSSEDNLEYKANKPSDLTALDLRIYDLEKEIKKLTANFEDLIFEIDDLKELYKKLDLDLATFSINNKNFTENNILNKSSISDEEVNDTNNNSLGTIVINSQDLTKQDNEIDSNVADNQKTNIPEIKMSPEEEFQEAFDNLRSQKFDEAKESFKTFIETHKDNTLSGSAHYWLGEIYILQKQHREAALILAEGYQKFPKSAKAPEILFKLSDSLIAIEKKSDACNTLKKIIKEFPTNKIYIKAEKQITSLQCETISE